MSQPAVFSEVYDSREGISCEMEREIYATSKVKAGDVVMVNAHISRWRKQGGWKAYYELISLDVLMVG